MIFISLGTRCTSAAVIKEQFNQRVKSYPFDWISIPIKNVAQFIRCENVEGFTKGYLSEIVSQNHPDGTWFPHDFVLDHYNGNSELMHSDTLLKYTRRIQRLHDTLKNGETLCFLITMVSSEDDYNHHFQLLRNLILEKSSGKCLFITVNLLPWSHIEGDANTNGSHFNFHVPLPPGDGSFKMWKDWEKNIFDTIMDNSQLQTFFEQ